MKTLLSHLKQLQTSQQQFQQRVQQVSKPPSGTSRTLKGLGGEIIFNQR